MKAQTYNHRPPIGENRDGRIRLKSTKSNINKFG